MWDRRKLLLAAIMFTAVYYRVTGESITLDMAQDAIDDQYDGCREKAMEKFIYSGLLGEELNDKDFHNTWQRQIHTKCSKLIPGGIKEHSIALSAYDDGYSKFIKHFNSLVKTMGRNFSTYENFHFKSFHFLLMDSLMLLRSHNCTTVYFATEKKYTAEKGSKVRFGTFNTGYLHYTSFKKSIDLDGMVVFKIYSCFFVNLEEHACNKDLALLSPAEVFTVQNVTTKEDEHDSEYTEIVLKHSGVHSNHNCYSFSRSPANVSTKWLVSLFVALSLFFFYF